MAPSAREGDFLKLACLWESLARLGDNPLAGAFGPMPDRTESRAVTKSRPRRIFYGWWVVAAGGTVQGYTSAVFFRGFQAFFDPIVETFGWSRGATAAALSLQRTEGGLISPFVGTLLDRFGPRRVMAFGVTITGASFVLMSQVTSLWQFYLAMALLTLGLSFGTFIVLVTTVGNWFIRYRARALAILMSASAAGGFTLPILVGAIGRFGWEDVLFAVGVGFWVIGYPAVFVMRGRPEQYGETPDGARAVASSQTGPGRRRPTREATMTVRETLRTRFFWQLAIAVSLGQLVSSTNLLHLPALRDFGVGPGLAAFAAGSVAIGDFSGRIGMGILGDRFDKRLLLAGAFVLMTTGTFALAAVNGEVLGISFGSALPLPVFAIGFGAGFGASIPLRLAMLADYFGRRSYGSVVGITSSVSAGFGAVGPIFVGVTYDVTGGYRPAFLILALILAVAIPLTLTLEKPARVAARARMAAAAARRRAQAGRAP